MNQEPQMTHPKDKDNKISLWNLPEECCQKFLLKLAYHEFDMTVKMAFTQIRNIALEKSGDPIHRLDNIGVIADAFHNWGGQPSP